MKKYMSFLVLLTVFLPAFADDVTAVVTETSPGLSNGQVDITVTGGVAPYQFNWSGPGGFTATTEDISGLDSGSYTVTVTDQYCGVAVLTVWVGTEVNTYAPVLSDASSLHVYPSPFHETVVITSEKKVENGRYRVCDMQGQVVAEKAGVSGDRFILDTQSLVPGIYLVELRDAFGVYRQRVVKR